MPGKIAVEVAYALPEKQYLQRVTLQEGATVEEAIRASGLLELRTDIDLTKNKVGIYSRPAKLSDTVCDGDRVEIYRPLSAGLLSILVNTPLLLKVSVSVCCVTPS